MRVPTLFALATLAVGCASTVPAPDALVPATVACGDSDALIRIADADRRFSSESKSDQDGILFGTRARFFTSLSHIADLRCKVPQADVEPTLSQALDAARQAEETASFYERTRKWGEAEAKAGAVITGLIAALPSATE